MNRFTWKISKLYSKIAFFLIGEHRQVLVQELSIQNVLKVVKVLVTQLRPTLCNSVDCSPPGFSVHGILQASILEWVAMPSSRGASQPRNQIHVSSISLYWQGDSLPLVPPGAFLAARTVKNLPAVQETQH